MQRSEVEPRFLPGELTYVEHGKSRDSFLRRAKDGDLRPRGKGPVSLEAIPCEFTALSP